MTALDEDPLVPTPHQLRLADSVMMQPYEIANDVFDRVPRFFDLG
jgi:hypothetical protein